MSEEKDEWDTGGGGDATPWTHEWDARDATLWTDEMPHHGVGRTSCHTMDARVGHTSREREGGELAIKAF